jgi:DNA invertase Pin-like site-specific DNA recombinase
MSRQALPGKIRPEHVRRQAIVYIRQSSAQQVRHHHESTQRQYALSERAVALGWPASSVVTIDEDQGRSGAGSVHRQGFRRLLAEIGAGQVGLVLALEASRLARSSADWHRLVEICVVTQTLLADESAIYDPRDPNDRLLLGVKGTISEAELFTLRCRLNEGRWNKARRGELARSLPVGYLRTENGGVVKDPDRQVQARLDYVFRLFAQLKVARRVVVRLVQEGLTIPSRVWGGPGHGQLMWKTPELSALMRLLHNPTYAGAYVYGAKEYDSFDRYPSSGKAKVHPRPLEEWPICLQGVYPAYLSWAQFVENQRVLRGNGYRAESRGAPRKGAALLQGIVFCGRCGARMSVLHYSTKEQRSPGYGCFAAYQRRGGATCQCMSARGIDEAVTELFLRAACPAQVEIALQALEELEADRQEALRQWELQLQRADYEVQLARRRYESADPENRMVAGELEARWEEALRQRERQRRERDEFERGQEAPLSDRDCRLLKDLSSDLESVWSAGTTTMEERKTLLRFLVRRVHLDGVSEAGKIKIEVEWHTGARTATTIDRLPVGVWAPRTPREALCRIRELLPEHDYDAIAERLNQEKLRSAKGLPFNARTVGYIVRSRGWNGAEGAKDETAQG